MPHKQNSARKNAVLCFCVIFVSLYACADDTAQIDQFKQQASETIKQLASNLKNELSASMQSGGPIAAVETCNIKAPQITNELNDKVSIKRTSLKLRNKKNAPDSWEQQILISFDKQLSQGIPIKELVHVEKFTSDSETTLRLMRAIPTQGLCLTCHGDKDTMSKELSNTLELTYPNDLATGYQVGQIRGAFSVSKTIKN